MAEDDRKRLQLSIITFMRIRELASKSQVSVQSIRFYEREGLLREPPRTSSGYRNYNESDVERIAFIKWCQPLGFTLKEVGELIELHAALTSLSTGSVPRPRQLQRIMFMAQQKSSHMQNKIKLLQAAVRQLAYAIKKLQSKHGPACPASSSPTRSKMARAKMGTADCQPDLKKK